MATYRYFDFDGTEVLSNDHFLTAKEICEGFNIYKNGKLPYKKLKKALDLIGVESYYYRPNPKTTFNQIQVYNFFLLTHNEVRLLKFFLGDEAK